MIYLRNILKYTLWLILLICCMILFAGVWVYRFNISQYIYYLNSVDMQTLSLKNPVHILQVFVPSQQKRQSIQEILDDNTLDTTQESDTMQYRDNGFDDAEGQSGTTQLSTGDDFGFVEYDGTELQDMTGYTQEEQQLILLDRIRNREYRLEQENNQQ